ncbi:uncharacterized protein LOC115628881 [Scaptodrosophila lebanonensis]|uniref:Uncharacterized protein LOC115628881 n=1 Tax=Drosophila lebanonensis TaxID=7225 RepID=A0A6J2U0J9_DROLE|nr:uncharacterized protein LOC115628881 [Scaptodrosophila lebanonensis]
MRSNTIIPADADAATSSKSGKVSEMGESSQSQGAGDGDAGIYTECCFDGEGSEKDPNIRETAAGTVEKSEELLKLHQADLTTKEILADSMDDSEEMASELEDGQQRRPKHRRGHEDNAYNGGEQVQKQSQEMVLENDGEKHEIKTDIASSSVSGTRAAENTPTSTISKPISPVEIKIENQSTRPIDSADAPPSPEPTTSFRHSPKITRSSINGTRTPTMLKRLRKSTRSTRFKAKMSMRNNASGNNNSNGFNGQNPILSAHIAASSPHPGSSKSHSKASGIGGAGTMTSMRSRRALFKRPAQKTPKVQACTKFVKSVFYKGSYMQIGDIVSIVDGEDGVYYAQIRGLLVDAYCEKSAFLTWLIPTQDSPDPKEGFDPATYLIGPDEELSRKLCYMEFVMHAPSNYYYDRTTPFPVPDVDEYAPQRACGYIWTRLPVVKREKNDAHS